ncbi:hypothetical protein ACFVAD_01605 [Sutcliffiella sp. NPDC057660]|uniref:hypothetical protein n=1 Tax=Sutcliffiella sp. NPDC057660 TaxID=3346199 RepID=UPI0036B2321D
MISEVALKEYLVLEYIINNQDTIARYNYIFTGIIQERNIILKIKNKAYIKKNEYHRLNIHLVSGSKYYVHSTAFTVYDPNKYFKEIMHYFEDGDCFDITIDQHELLELIKIQIINLLPQGKKILHSLKEGPFKMGSVYVLSIVVVLPIILNLTIFQFTTKVTVGSLSDWMTFFAGIIGGIGGGFFTFLAIQYTERKQKGEKTRIDINFLSYYTYFLKEKNISLLWDIDQIGTKITHSNDFRFLVNKFPVWNQDLIKASIEIREFCNQNIHKLSTYDNKIYMLNLRILDAYKNIEEWLGVLSLNNEKSFYEDWAPNFTDNVGISKIIKDIVRDLQFLEAEYNINSKDIWMNYILHNDIPHIKG